MSGDWPEREEGWEDILQARVRALFAETAERHGLQYEWGDAPVEVACTYPRQPGLDFELWLTLQGDEFVCGGDSWSMTTFPLDAADKWQTVSDTLDGLITGRARVLLYTPLLRSKPYWTVVQLETADGWRNVSTGLGCAAPPIARLHILRNGMADAGDGAGSLKPAWGSLLGLGLIIALGYWIFG